MPKLCQVREVKQMTWVILSEAMEVGLQRAVNHLYLIIRFMVASSAILEGGALKPKMFLPKHTEEQGVMVECDGFGYSMKLANLDEKMQG